MAPTDTPAGALPPALAKASDAVVQNLATMYKMCHQLEPDSPACQALIEMQRAMAEIEKSIGLPVGMDTPSGEQAPTEAPSPMGGGPFAEAAQSVHQQMAAGPPGGGPQ